MRKKYLAALLSICVAVGAVFPSVEISATEGTEETAVEEVVLDTIETEDEPEMELPIGGLLPEVEMEVPEEEPVDYFEEAEDNIVSEYSFRNSAVYSDSAWTKYGNYYFYNQMSEAERAYWDDLEAMCVEYITNNTDATAIKNSQTGEITGYRTKLVKSALGLTKDEMKQVAHIFKYSNPQYYFINNAIWSNSSAVGFGIYTAFSAGTDRQAATEEVQRQVETWQAQIDACSTEEEKVKLIHDLVIEKVEYNKGIYDKDFDENAQYSQSAYSVFCTDLTVCAGYSQAFQMMCNGSDIDALSVTSSDHQWNKVRVNDSWYNVDCTWDDQSNTVYYNYFERNDAVFDQSSSHAEETFWEEYLPVCSLDSGATSYSPGALPQITEQVAQPTITGITSETGTCILTISGGSTDTDIYYSLDGTIPEVSAVKCYKYRDGFEVIEPAVVKVIAVSNAYLDSEVVSREITLESSYSIQYNENGDTPSNVREQKVYAGTGAVIQKNMFLREGYSFQGWNTMSDGGGTSYQEEETLPALTQNMVLYAQWKPITYNISYELNGGINAENPTGYTYADNITLKAPNKTGYTFEGWYADANYSNQVENIPSGSTGDKVFYAKWTPNHYSIIFDGNGSNSGSMAAMSGLSYDVEYQLNTNAFKKTERVFQGWNTKKDGSGIAYSNGQSIKNLTSEPGGTITLYAQWKEKTYKITYKLKGGKNNSKNPSVYTKSAAVTLKKPTRAGYTFEGWYADSKCKKKVTGIKKGSTGNKTFYAKWKVKKYKITYQLKGGKNNSKNPTFYYCTSKTITLKKPTRSGYRFMGWYSDSKYKKKVTKIKKGSTGNRKLYAKWKKI